VGDRTARPTRPRQVNADGLIVDLNRASTQGTDVVMTWSDEVPGRPPLIVLDALEVFLDEAGIGSGPIDAAPIGGGHSNVIFEIARAGARVVLRRPPRPPLAPSAHDVLREANILGRLHAAGVRVPKVLAQCEDPAVIGMPFFVMEHVDGVVISEHVPTAFAGARDRLRIGYEAVDALAELHAVDLSSAGMDDFGRRTGYLERQLRRFNGIWDTQRTREIPEIVQVHDWLVRHLPESGPATVVHGDYRLGNLVYGHTGPVQMLAVLDWEMATLGDPRADIGYLCATWAERGDGENPMSKLSAATRLPGFPSRDEVRERYARMSGRDLEGLDWYEVLALWKCAIFLESSYRRHVDGTTDDAYFVRLDLGVPMLADLALERTRQAR
jgi:aminoglycoside phosphotransferase (APT) family kinase protein